jgi:hypothetical protein
MIKQRECTNSIGIVNWKTFLTDVNSSLNNFWTINEIDSVSSKLSCNPLQNLGEIFKDGLLKPVARKINSIQAKVPIIKYYSLNNYNPDQGILYSTKILDENQLPLQENIVFAPTLIAPNKKENISQLLYETFTIKEEGTNDNILSAIGFYFDETPSLISSVDSAIYAVTGGTGYYDGATRVKIDFFNDNDLLRKITIYF